MSGTEITNGNGRQASQQTDILGAMRSEVNRVFEQFERGWPRFPSMFRRGTEQGLVPEFDVHENAKQLTIEADLPGVDQKDVTVTLANGLLTIKGERKTERDRNQENYYMAERSYGVFKRSLRLPETIDEKTLEAKFDKGVLIIVAQKRPEAQKAERKIEVKTG